LLDPALDIRETVTLLTVWTSEPGRAEVEAFYRDHRADLEQRMPKDEVTSGFGAIADAFVAACDARRRDDIAHELESLYAGRPGGERDERLAIEQLDRCIASRAVLGPAVRSWLGGVKQHKPDAKPAKPGRK
jgi:hypothetical protein